MEGKIEDALKDDQFGFRRGRGTRDAIGCMRMLAERFVSVDREICVCFLDWEKAFDRVNWNSLLPILKDIGVDFKDRRFIKELYMRQNVSVRFEEIESEFTYMGRESDRGAVCPLPYLTSMETN